MLIDASHKRWVLYTAAAAGAALGLYAWLAAQTAGGVTGGSAAGLGFGVVAYSLMVFAGLQSALRKVPAWWWIGSRQAWLKGHIWLGLLSSVFLLCHSGFRWGGPLERLLWVLFCLTIITGVFGLVLQQILPRLLTLRIAREAPYEQIPHIYSVLRGKAAGILAEVWESHKDGTTSMRMQSQGELGARYQFQTFYDDHVWPFLSDRSPRLALLTDRLRAETAFQRIASLPGLAAVKEKVVELESLCEERRQLGEQERLHHWLHGWLLLHVPLALALLVLGLAHAVMALYYS